MTASGGKPGGPNLGISGPDHPQWKGDGAGYSAAHMRLKRLRGRAAEHDCAWCGNRAHDWAYNLRDPDPDQKLNGAGYPYSFDPARYLPLCVSCHRLMEPGRPNSAKTHCPQKHEYTEENTVYYARTETSHGGRTCRTCRDDRSPAGAAL